MLDSNTYAICGEPNVQECDVRLQRSNRQFIQVAAGESEFCKALLLLLLKEEVALSEFRNSGHSVRNVYQIVVVLERVGDVLT